MIFPECLGVCAYHTFFFSALNAASEWKSWRQRLCAMEAFQGVRLFADHVYLCLCIDARGFSWQKADQAQRLQGRR